MYKADSSSKYPSTNFFLFSLAALVFIFTIEFFYRNPLYKLSVSLIGNL